MLSSTLIGIEPGALSQMEEMKVPRTQLREGLRSPIGRGSHSGDGKTTQSSLTRSGKLDPRIPLDELDAVNDLEFIDPVCEKFLAMINRTHRR